MQNNLGRLGGQLGVLLCLLGFVAIFFGWNGAASKALPSAQFPFLISGGITGLALVAIGASLLVVQNAREDRARVEAALDRLHQALERHAGQAGGGPGLVLAGTTSYHRTDCSLPAAREESHLLPVGDAVGRGLEPCRVCRPPALGLPVPR